MKLSVVIVNYNVKYFLEQALHSVRKAMTRVSGEVFVVDNNSVDGSCRMIKDKFKEVILIENKENIGFSKANNQAIRIAQGEYILLLNPDTLVEEDTFEKIIAFMDSTPDAGGLGVKMIDGKGNYLPESKRGLPTPITAFYKIFGLTRLFPHSKRFARYYMGHLSPNKTHEVEVLAGAFMLLRKTALDKAGLLDESFFMYGEDIDLSYRIAQAGYKNFYFADTTIIHYKGESTKKGSINYVVVFYNAMIIFAQKHFAKKQASLYTALIRIAIYLRAFLSLTKRLLERLITPFIDASTILAGYYWGTPYWENYKFNGGNYPSQFMSIAVPIYIIVWITSLYMLGSYRRPFVLSKNLKAIAWGTATILIAYALLPEEYRYSRALILIGAIWTLGVSYLSRFILHLLPFNNFTIRTNRKKKVIIVGETTSIVKVKEIMLQAQIKNRIIGTVAVNNNKTEDDLGEIAQLNEIVRINKPDEIIFCANNMTSTEIIRTMLALSNYTIEFKIAPPDSLSIIGSNSINSTGELYTIDINSIAEPQNRRKKRTFDIFLAFVLLPIFAWNCILSKNKISWLADTWNVLIGKKTWVGYCKQSTTHADLPPIKDGVFCPTKYHNNSQQAIQKINVLYAKNYKITHDIKIIWQNIIKVSAN